MGIGQTAEVLVGEGEHAYVWESDFFKLPPNVDIEANTHAVAVDKSGRIYVHSPSEAAVIAFDPEGHYIRHWGSWLKAGAHGMDIREEDGVEFIYFAATSLHRVFKTSLEGERVFELGYPEESERYANESAYVPTNVAFSPNGDFYVADGYGSHYVHQYTREGGYVRTWGGNGSDPGQLDCPHGIWVDARGSEPAVIVADRSNRRLQTFSLDGEHLGFVSGPVRAPCTFDSRGDELLVPDLEGRLTILDRKNNVVVHLGDNPDLSQRAANHIPRSEWMDGVFIAPHDACWDADGNILVAEWLADGGRLTRLRKL